MSAPILRYFSVTHLQPGPLRQTSALFAELAVTLDDLLPAGPESTVALRKLLEAKDAAVRAALDLPTQHHTISPECAPGACKVCDMRRELAVAEPPADDRWAELRARQADDEVDAVDGAFPSVGGGYRCPCGFAIDWQSVDGCEPEWVDDAIRAHEAWCTEGGGATR